MQDEQDFSVQEVTLTFDGKSITLGLDYERVVLQEYIPLPDLDSKDFTSNPEGAICDSDINEKGLIAAFFGRGLIISPFPDGYE
ncbi:hypothetical protein BWQ96_02550 [Gracilariopsis chorda]|uniref:Uncharacterized protein n=1 Tax=Gracilariopsis chorda TaxID=448386 RepID=A0A2V3IZX1_9FLOR|nr:hypothetical protein BWQ96_02550 [Gracilariopsis chorda]|eukprot:PXF47688.1 hypothetical protein BWQ96_02550 [Gracilariopsis chorda]